MAGLEPIVPINDLSRRFTLGSELMSSVCELVANGPYFNSEYTAAFEAEFSKYVRLSYCTSVSSGTAALELSIKALALPANSIILMTANAGGYAAIAAKNSGFGVRYVEVDDFGLLDLSKIEQNLNGVSAIIVTHLYGQVCDMEALMSLATRNDLKVIEDCAQAVGSAFKSKPAGSFGHIAAFSFYPTKNLGGIGDSGAVCTNSQDLNNRVLRLREYGWTDRYFATEKDGGNYRNDEIQSLILLNQLSNLSTKNDTRRRIWKRYWQVCETFGVQILGNLSDDFVPHLAVLRISRRDEFIEHMKERRIGVSIHYPFPDYLQPGLPSGEAAELTLTSRHCNEVVSIPLFPELSESEIRHVEESLTDFLGEVSA